MPYPTYGSVHQGYYSKHEDEEDTLVDSGEEDENLRSVHTARSVLVIHLLTKEEKRKLGIAEVVGVVTKVHGLMGFIKC